eukprot:s430_g7.t1
MFGNSVPYIQGREDITEITKKVTSSNRVVHGDQTEPRPAAIFLSFRCRVGHPRGAMELSIPRPATAAVRAAPVTEVTAARPRCSNQQGHLPRAAASSAVGVGMLATALRASKTARRRSVRSAKVEWDLLGVFFGDVTTRNMGMSP